MKAFVPQDQVPAALSVLDFVSDLFTEAGKDHFTREQVLIVLNCVRNDAEIFAPEDVADYDAAAAEVLR